MFYEGMRSKIKIYRWARNRTYCQIRSPATWYSILTFSSGLPSLFIVIRWLWAHMIVSSVGAGYSLHQLASLVDTMWARKLPPLGYLRIAKALSRSDSSTKYSQSWLYDQLANLYASFTILLNLLCIFPQCFWQEPILVTHREPPNPPKGISGPRWRSGRRYLRGYPRLFKSRSLVCRSRNSLPPRLFIARTSGHWKNIAGDEYRWPLQVANLCFNSGVKASNRPWA